MTDTEDKKIALSPKPGSKWEAATVKYMKQIMIYGSSTPEAMKEYKKDLADCFEDEIMPQMMEGLAKKRPRKFTTCPVCNVGWDNWQYKQCPGCDGTLPPPKKERS